MIEQKSLTDTAWENIFEEHGILNAIDTDGRFLISASEIRKYREPRLMAKFDHMGDLPKIFKNNGLSILPVSRGEYIISHFLTYHSVRPVQGKTEYFPLPEEIQSLSAENIFSESVAINCAYAAGIFHDFLREDNLYPTVSGRMRSGSFQFHIQDVHGVSIPVSVTNSQIEIDSAMEGCNGLALIEAKCDLAYDFLVRQLYYPFRTWSSNKQICKPVRPVFMMFSNGIFHLYEYKFLDVNDYNSLCVVRRKKYTIENPSITMDDLQKIWSETEIIPDPPVPFPQADTFDRIVNLCEGLYSHELNNEQVAEENQFVMRQSDYYANACRYLGLCEAQKNAEGEKVYILTEYGRKIMKQNHRARQLSFCSAILSHKIFHDVFELCLNTGLVPDKHTVSTIIRECNAYHVESANTFQRRAYTVIAWVRWILDLTQN